jgi:regulator of sigma E protease
VDWFLIAKTAETSWWLQPSSYLAILMMAAGLGVLIFVHEFGHFAVAKLCGVKCEKFYLGFDIPIGKLLASLLRLEKEVTLFGVPIPSSIVKFRWGETVYGIGILPLGGYVKMLGQDDNPAAAARERERSMIQKEHVAAAATVEELAADADGKESTAPTSESNGGEGEEEFVLDPRSYQAKSVPQRMAIISAGVIMNLLTAPLFATAAYLMGVDYLPCVVGTVVPGGAAYQAGMQPGDRILQLGGHDSRYEHTRFDWDLRQGMAMLNEGDSLQLLVRHPDGKTEKLTIQPITYYDKKGEKAMAPSIGIAPSRQTVIASADLYEGMPASKASPPIEDYDKVVGVRPVGAADFEQVTDYFQIRSLLVRYYDQELELQLERKTDAVDEQGEPKTELVTSKVAANKFRGIGLVMKPGPIDAVYPGSPADKAGIKPGDRIKSVAGTPFGGGGIDPMLLGDFLRKLGQDRAMIEVERDGKTESLEVLIVVPDTFDLVGLGKGTPMSSAALGISYPVTLTVDFVRPDSPAAKAGLTRGDVLTDVVFLPTSEKPDNDEQLMLKIIHGGEESVELDELSANWTWLYDNLQSLPENKIKLTYARAGKKQTPVELAGVEIDAFNPERGFAFALLSQNQQAGSFGEAFLLGLRETKENFVRVLIFLKKLVTGGISPTNLGGPGTIAVVATSQASQGASTLLLFLTFLSVNLAIVNFLPIPVLDGGHMMFLIYEAIRGKPADERWLTTLTLIGFAFILCLMVFVIGLDIVRLAPS